jgi:hypothetical protein
MIRRNLIRKLPPAVVMLLRRLEVSVEHLCKRMDAGEISADDVVALRMAYELIEDAGPVHELSLDGVATACAIIDEMADRYRRAT